MKVTKFVINMFAENCYIVFDEDSREAMIVDPGMVTENERKQVDDFIAREKLTLKYLVNTHLHLDHCFGNAHIERKYGLTTHASIAESSFGHDINAQARMFGIPGNFENIGTISDISKYKSYQLGKEHLYSFSTPGHSPGGVCIVNDEDRWIITGDTLFADGNVGRTDLPGGDFRALMESVDIIKSCVFEQDYLILPGHGPESTIGRY